MASDVLASESSVQKGAAPPQTSVARITARALLLGERIDTAGLERSDVISTSPLAFRVGAIEIAPDRDDQVIMGGPISLKDLSPPRLLVVADVLAKNVALVRDEREVTKVLELVEPFASQLAQRGRPPANRRNMLQLIGQALLVHHRMSGRVQVEEKPDVLWDRSDLERLYARLADEYELKERASALRHKLQVIDETMRALTDIIDTERSIRLEWTIIALIIVEVLIAFYDLFFRMAK